MTRRKRDGQFDEGIRIKHPRRHDEIAGLKGACGRAYRQFLTTEACLKSAGPLPVVFSGLGQMFPFKSLSLLNGCVSFSRRAACIS